MPIRRHIVEITPLPAALLAGLAELSTTLVSDAMNREGAMAGAIKPLAPGMRLGGPARTVTVMAGDNGAIHAAIRFLGQGDILVVDAGGIEDTAVWGEIMTRAAMHRGVGGLVVDGAIRDAAELRELGFPVFCRAVVPGGPHKGWGGTIDGTIACAGVPVSPGDLMLGDDNCVVVVPAAIAEAVLETAQAGLAREQTTMRKIEAGQTTAELLGIPAPEIIG